MKVKAVGSKAIGFGGFVRYLVRRYRRDEAARMAASLSYTSLLSLVPLMAIALAMLAAFPVFDDIRGQIQAWVFQNFVPAVGDVVQKQVAAFIANAGKLTAAGVVGLGFTAIMLLVTIEGVMNRVFRVVRDRTPLNKLLVYWTVLTLGPLLMGLSLSLQTYLTAASKWAVGAVGRSNTAWLTAPLPTLLSILAFAILYVAVPNRRIRVKDALVGAVVAGLLFAALRWGFGLYITSSGAYTNVYGAVAVVPIFLFWMFLSWTTVLIGAEITAALPEWRAGYHEGNRKGRGARRLTIALDVIAMVTASMRAGKGGISRKDMLDTLALAERDMLPVLHRLITTGFVAPTSNRRYLLARDLDATTLDDLVQALELDLSLDDDVATDAAWRPAVEDRIQSARGVMKDQLHVPLAQLVGQFREDSPAT